MKNNALFLSPSNPFGIGGGSFATHAFLRAFSDIFDGRIDLVMADEWQSEWDNNIRINKRFNAKPLSRLQYCLSLFTGEIQRFSGEAKRIIMQKPSEYSFIICNGSSIGGQLCRIAKQLGMKLITIHHNYEPEYFSANTRGVYRYLYLPVVKRMEREAYLNSDYNFFLTNQDMVRFQAEYGCNQSNNEVIGVFEFKDYADPQIKTHFSEPATFIITGSLCTMQGIDGIKYFFDELYSSLPENCNVIIAGRDPEDGIIELCGLHENVQLISNPLNMSDVISSGDVYICPTRVGGGLKLRVMDGLRLGLPVITHICSARGYDVFVDTPYMRLFDNQASFKKAVNDILMSIKSVSKEDVIRLYKSVFSYNEGVQRIRKALE